MKRKILCCLWKKYTALLLKNQAIRLEFLNNLLCSYWLNICHDTIRFFYGYTLVFSQSINNLPPIITVRIPETFRVLFGFAPFPFLSFLGLIKKGRPIHQCLIPVIHRLFSFGIHNVLNNILGLCEENAVGYYFF